MIFHWNEVDLRIPQRCSEVVTDGWSSVKNGSDRYRLHQGRDLAKIIKRAS